MDKYEMLLEDFQNLLLMATPEQYVDLIDKTIEIPRVDELIREQLIQLSEEELEELLNSFKKGNNNG